MKKFQNHLIGVDHGDLLLFSDFENGGVMWNSVGDRQICAYVEFSECFNNIPIVHVNLSMWDIASHTNARVDVRAEKISKDGFIIVFQTWGDTMIARVRVAWQAIGELPQTDEWEL
ncbi:MAG: H-type lectin domain-containing protein [Octadecabacter sp.]|nr:H-type lectin domain-containing protein [Octadecabacter sp.]